MAARRSKSKRQSAANSASTSQRDLVFFIDKCLGGKIVPDALRAQGEKVELMESHFAEDTEDTVWIPDVGKRGWVILTKDKRLRHNVLELIAFLKSGTHSFILTSGNQTGAEMAKAFVSGLPTIKGIVHKFRPPIIATVSSGGLVRVLRTYDQLIKQITEARV